MKVVKAKISDLIPDDINANKGTEYGQKLIEKSLRELGAGRSIVIDRNNRIISGNKTVEYAGSVGLEDVVVVETTGDQIVAVRRTDIDLDSKRGRELAIADNATAKVNIAWDEANIAALKEQWDIEPENWGIAEFANVDEKEGANKQGSLEERFIIPPFSILDTKSGRWQNRKNEWLSLGIKSEIGREEDLTFSRSSQPPRIYDLRNKIREKTGFDPSWDEIIEYCKINNIPTQDGTSIFDPVLCEIIYRWFNTPKGLILDPFAGGSVRGIVAAKLGMQYYGVDLRREQIEANYQNAKEVIGEQFMPYWVCEDSMNIDKLFYKNKYDLAFSCPPYADLEVYSDDPRDLSNMKYEEFIQVYREIIKKTCSLLNDNRFAVFVVGEVRNKAGIYYNFIADTIDAFRSAGLAYYNEMILVNQIGSLAIRVSRQFNGSRKIGKHHQNVLVFFKGDTSKIKSIFPEIEYSEEEISAFCSECEENV